MQKKPITSNARLFFFFTVLVSIAMALIIAYVITLRVEFEGKRTAEQAIPVQDMGWVGIKTDGALIFVNGDAPDDAAHFRVVEAISREVNINRIQDNVVEPEREVHEPELSIEIVQNARMSSIIGLLPKSPSPIPLYHALEDQNPDVETLNLVEALDKPVDPSWEQKVEYLAFVVKTLENFKMSATEASVTIETIVADQSELDALKAELRAPAPADYEVDLQITAPRPLIAPFVFQAEVINDQPKIERCSATTQSDLRPIRNALPNVEDTEFETCQLGLGAPTEDWGLFVAELIEASEPLSNYNLLINDNQVSLNYSDQEDVAKVDEVSAKIRASLPPGFGYDSERIVTVKSIEELEADGNSVSFRVSNSPSKPAMIEGVVGSEAMKLNVDSIAAAKFGTGENEYIIDIVDGLPPNWEKRIFASINAVSALEQGEAILTPDFLSIKGTIESDEKKAIVFDALSAELGDFTINDEVKVTGVASIAGGVDPMECVDQINAVLQEKAIEFEPSSTRISAESNTTISRVAQILFECRAHSFEIAGHTDSKGSDEVNLKISQGRAEAVLDALLAQALEFGSVTAKGYGESEPIADNDTDEGRANNRRIEIRISERAGE